MAEPLRYYENNLFGLVNLLKCVEEFDIPYFVFSSSTLVLSLSKEFKTSPVNT